MSTAARTTAARCPVRSPGPRPAPHPTTTAVAAARIPPPRPDPVPKAPLPPAHPCSRQGDCGGGRVAGHPTGMAGGRRMFGIRGAVKGTLGRQQDVLAPAHPRPPPPLPPIAPTPNALSCTGAMSPCGFTRSSQDIELRQSHRQRRHGPALCARGPAVPPRNSVPKTGNSVPVLPVPATAPIDLRVRPPAPGSALLGAEQPATWSPMPEDRTPSIMEPAASANAGSLHRRSLPGGGP